MRPTEEINCPTREDLRDRDKEIAELKRLRSKRAKEAEEDARERIRVRSEGSRYQKERDAFRNELIELYRTIAQSRKASMGGINDTYIATFSRPHIDKKLLELKEK